MTDNDDRHGTYEGWLAHEAESSHACDGCKAAHAEVADMLRDVHGR